MTRRHKLWLLGFVLFLGAILPRLLLTTTSRFTEDEAMLWENSKHFAEGKSFPLLGPSVSGGSLHHPGAGFYYLMAFSQWVSPTPEAANVWTAIINALGIVLFWLALRSAFGEVPALLSAILLCFSPWSLLYSDRIWNPNISAVLVIIGLWSAFRVRERPHSRSIALLVFVAGIYPQFHLTAPVVWVSLALLVLGVRKQWNRKWLFIGVGFLLLAYVPYLVSEFRTGFSNLSAYFSDSRSNHIRAELFRVPIYAFRLLTLDITYHELMGYWGSFREWAAFKTLFTGTTEHPFSIFRFGLTVASFWFAGWALKASFQKNSSSSGSKGFGEIRMAIVVGIIADALLLGVAKKPFFAHYLQFFVPFLFLFYARLFQLMLPSKESFRRCLVFCALFCIGGLETSLTLSRSLDARNGLQVERQVLERILQKGGIGEMATLGLGFGFPGGSKFAYQVLLREAFHQRSLIVSPPGEVNYFLAPVSSRETGELLGPIVLIPGIRG